MLHIFFFHYFFCDLQIEGETFSGTGPSKQIAKNICAEHVVQYVVTKKCTESKVKVVPTDPESKPPMEDETPWLQLASLALFKLFNDWQAQGFVIPNELMKNPNEAGNGNGTVVPATGNGNGNMDVTMGTMPQAAQKPKQAKKMPDNPTERHPVQLLNELRGGVTFTVVGSSGVTPNIIFTLGKFLTKSTELDNKSLKWSYYSTDHKNYITNFFEHFLSKLLDSQKSTFFRIKPTKKLFLQMFGSLNDILQWNFFLERFG